MLDLNVLKCEKRKQRITYEELARMTGVAKTDICKICNNQCVTVNLEKVDKIRAALGLGREALIIKGKEPIIHNDVMKGQIKM